MVRTGPIVQTLCAGLLLAACGSDGGVADAAAADGSAAGDGGLDGRVADAGPFDAEPGDGAPLDATSADGAEPADGAVDSRVAVGDADVDFDCAAPDDGWCVPRACYGTAASDRSFDSPPPTCGALPAGDRDCCPDNLRPPPEVAATTLYLDREGCAETGTCGTYLAETFPRRRGLTLPSDPAAYPLKIVLPALEGADPECASLCPAHETLGETAAGFAITAPEEFIGFGTSRALAISVPAPWLFVSGGCGEACTYPCLGGYQEFGVQSCITLTHGDFGLSTADPNAPSVEALVELVDFGDTPAHEYAPGGCCLFAAP